MNYEIVSVDIDTFLRHYAPFYPEDEAVKQCMTNLNKARLLRANGGENSWTSYQTTPSSLQVKETEVYTPLVKICDTIGQANIPTRSVQCRFVQRPQSMTAPETPGSSQNLGGIFVPYSASVHTWTDDANTILNAEFKVHNVLKEVIENRKRCFDGALRCINEDARRTHMYSMTIEDSQMSFWYWSRSHSAMSKAFDFTKDAETTVRALMSFLFASMEELGYDDAIQRRQDPKAKNFCLIFKISDQYYKALRCISEYHATVVRGRATRVYDAIPVTSFDDLTQKGNPVVVKYTWLEHGAPTERETQDRIFGNLDSFAEGLLKRGEQPPHFSSLGAEMQDILQEKLKDERYKSHFLTILNDAKGCVSKAVAHDAEFTDSLFSGPRTEVLASLVSRGPDTLTPKQQYLVVFKERGWVLHKLAKFRDVLRAMKDCFISVTLLFLAGWMHRDISSGNLFWYQNRGLLADLEHAKRFDPEGLGKSDPKTGTAFFMAVELVQNRFFSVRKREVSLFSDLEPNPDPSVIHNFTHDIESFFWVLLWTVTARLDIKELNVFSTFIFVNSIECPPTRVDMFTKVDWLVVELSKFLPKELQSLIRPINAFRQFLFNHYIDSRPNDPKLASYSPIYHFAYQVLGICERIVHAPALDNLLASHQDATTTDAVSPSQQYLRNEAFVPKHMPKERQRVPDEDEEEVTKKEP